MFIVHHLEDSRSQRVLWLLEEMGLEYEVRRYARDPVTKLAPPELRAIHPLGKSPILQDGDAVIAETGAIVEHLVDLRPQAGLRPPPGTEERRRFTYWMHYAEGSAMTPLLLKLIFGELPRRSPGLVRPVVKGISSAVLGNFVDPQIKTHADFWEAELGRSAWFAGDQFTAADVMMSFPLEAAASRGDMGGRPRVRDFLKRIHARPAYARALERGGPYAYA
ncbi:MAG: glutathione S-transferase [Caulobacteraceae bacterium]|nr:glutathione S-transferase [Caulobacteraceae bacterium]